MKRIITVLFLVLSTVAFSQKVKFKKDKVIIDDVEMYNYDREGFMTTFSTLSSQEFMSVLITQYQTRNESYYQMKDPEKYSISPYKTENVFTVKFLQSGKEMFTQMSDKEVIKAFFKANLMDENGKIDEEKLDVFITKYNNENLKLKIK